MRTYEMFCHIINYISLNIPSMHDMEHTKLINAQHAQLVHLYRNAK